MQLSNNISIPMTGICKKKDFLERNANNSGVQFR